MLEHIAEHGTEAQREKATQNLQLSAQFREERALAPTVAAPAAAEAIGKHRLVYSADHTSQLPGRLVRREGEPPSDDAAVDEAYDGAGATYDLYWDIYQRNSIDGNGMQLISTVHYQTSYDNAFWDGTQMVYGDGDEDLPPAQRLFNRFTIAIDVIAHELTHGVTQYTGNLTYYAQPGALNESFSDVFGSLVKQRKMGHLAKDADWIIGEGLFTENVNGVGIRSMKSPGTAYDDPVVGKDPQPAHMKDYVNTIQDNGGVHINSGIPNLAFCLASIEMGGYAWEKAGRIWYVTLSERIEKSTNFQGAANLTHAVAGELYGENSLEQQAVSKGWAGVGITVGAPEGSGCLAGLFKRKNR
jgi:Zn-dependent metalloprotease